MTVSAAHILQTYLNDLSDAVLSDRFEDYALRVVLPFRLVTAAANLVVPTLDELHDGFDSHASMLGDMQVTELRRPVLEAGFDTPGTLVGTYQTTHFSGSSVVVPTFFSMIWLRSVGEIWKAVEIHNTTQDARWPILHHKVGAPFWPPRDVLG